MDAGTVAPYSLSWAGDRRLAFLWATGNNPHPPGIGIRVLDVTAPGTLLQASRLISRYSRFCAAFGVCRDDLLVTPDGSKVLVTKEVSSGGGTTASIEEISTDTGRAMATVAPPDGSLTPGPLCEPLWADPSGQQVMTYCGHGERYDNGHVSPADLHFPFDILNFGTGSNAFAW